MSDQEKFHILRNHGEPTRNLMMEDVMDILEGND